jgi:hypothetical protein
VESNSNVKMVEIRKKLNWIRNEKGYVKIGLKVSTFLLSVAGRRLSGGVSCKVVLKIFDRITE